MTNDVHETVPAHVTVVVAILVTVLPFRTIASLPAVHVDDVARPLKDAVIAPVEPENESGYAPESDVTPVFVIVRPEPMMDCPAVTEIPVPLDTVPVATLDTPAPPFDMRSCPPVRFVVVAIPVQVSVEFVPPTRFPRAE